MVQLQHHQRVLTYNSQATDDVTPASQLQYQIDSGSWQTIPSNQQISIPVTQHSDHQSHTISVKDLAGNTVSQSISLVSL